MERTVKMCGGLVVMGGDSCFKGRGFKSQHCGLDGHFSHLFVLKIVMFCSKRPKINEKEATDCQFKNEALTVHLTCSHHIQWIKRLRGKLLPLL